MNFRYRPLHSYVTYKDDYVMYNLVIPGQEKEEFDVDVKSGVLIIKCCGVTDKTSIPDEVDLERISAEYKAGILKVKLPYKEAEKPKKIEVT